MPDTPRQDWKIYHQRSWMPGLNRYFQDDLIQDGESVLLENCEVWRDGTLRRRGGYTERNSILGTAARPTQMITYKPRSRPTALVTLLEDSSSIIIDEDTGTLRTVTLTG